MISLQLFLEKIGLSEIESKLYIGLLQSGATTVLELARTMKIKRATVHFNVESLIQRGLVTQVKYGARRQIVAEPPEKLNLFLDEKISGYQKLEQNLSNVIKMIHTSMPKIKENTDAQIRFYQGKKSLKLIYDDVLKAKELRAYDTSNLDDIFPENAQLFSETHNAREDMYIWEIMDESPAHDTYVNSMAKGRYAFKTIPNKLEITDYLIYDNKVAIIDTENKDEDTVTGMLINNENFYKSSKTLFDLIWHVLP